MKALILNGSIKKDINITILNKFAKGGFLWKVNR